MTDKLMYIPKIIHKIIPFIDYNKWSQRLKTQLNEPTNHNLMKAARLLSYRIRKRYYKTLGTSVIYSLMSLHTAVGSLKIKIIYQIKP